VEGHEFQALQGAQELLRTQAIDFIQFDLRDGHRTRGLFFRIFYLSTSYQIAEFAGRSQADQDYHERLEIFAYTNYLAVSRKLTNAQGD